MCIRDFSSIFRLENRLTGCSAKEPSGWFTFFWLQYLSQCALLLGCCGRLCSSSDTWYEQGQHVLENVMQSFLHLWQATVSLMSPPSMPTFLWLVNLRKSPGGRYVCTWTWTCCIWSRWLHKDTYDKRLSTRLRSREPSVRSSALTLKLWPCLMYKIQHHTCMWQKI